MNKVFLIGSMVKDPELKFLPGKGTATVSFSIAVKRDFKNASGEYESDFVNVVIFGKTAENVANYTQKGSKIAVAGRIQVRNYEAKDGTKRYVTEVVANEVQFLDSKKKDNKPPADMFGATPMDDGDIPF